MYGQHNCGDYRNDIKQKEKLVCTRTKRIKAFRGPKLEISLQKLIELVTAEVVKELKKHGMQVVEASGKNASNTRMHNYQTKTERIDMSKYKSPILSENHIKQLHELTGNLIVPQGTIITPKAKELLKEKNLIVKIEN